SGPMFHLNQPRISQQPLWVSPVPVNAMMPTNVLLSDMENLLARVELLEHERRRDEIRMDELENAVRLVAEADSKLVDSHLKEMEKTKILEERIAELEYLVASLQAQPRPANRHGKTTSTSSCSSGQHSSFSGNKKNWMHRDRRIWTQQTEGN